MEFAVDVIAEVARRDASIARVLREICTLDGAARRCALDLVAAHLGPAASRDVVECLEALRGDELVRELAERLDTWGAPGAPQAPPVRDAPGDPGRPSTSGARPGAPGAPQGSGSL